MSDIDNFMKNFMNNYRNNQNNQNNNFQRKSREETISSHNFNIKMSKEYSKNTSNMVSMKFHNVLELGTYHPLGKNLEEDFQEIKIKNLEIKSCHPKKYIILQIISKTLLVDSLNFIGEDSNKEVINIAVYDAEKYYNIKGWDELENKIFTEGKYLIVIEPFYTLCTCPCGYDKIRIESPNEIIIFDTKEEMLNFLDKIKPENLSPDNFKFIGNLMMKKKLYEKAIFYYEKGIKESKSKIDDNLDIILHSNLSEAYNKYGYFTKCIQNADYCLNKINKLIKDKVQTSSDILSQQKLKALYRKIKGLISLRKFKEAYEILFSDENDNNDKDKDIIKELLNFGEMKEFINLIKEGNENNLGHFDFNKMLSDEKINFNLDNYGDYFNPKLEIQFEKDKGIKIVAKEEINLGELILVEKALASKENREERGRIGVINLKRLNSDPSEEIDLFMKLAQKVSKYPLDNEKFYYLYDGKNLNEDINQRKKYLENQINGKLIITNEKVNNVIYNNKYQIGRNFVFFNSNAIGIWGYASLINNDCLANTIYLGIGDFFILYSTKEIKKGEEITCTYNNFSLTFKDRQKELLNSWGFKCKCKLCEYQEKNNYSDYDKFIKLFSPNADVNIIPEIVESFEKHLKENENNYNSYELANAYLQLENMSSQIKNIDNTKKYSDLVTKYAEGEHYSFQLSNIYNVVLCYIGLKNTEEIFDYMKNIKNFLSKKSPFTIDQIQGFIDDNFDNCSKKDN